LPYIELLRPSPLYQFTRAELHHNLSNPTVEVVENYTGILAFGHSLPTDNTNPRTVLKATCTTPYKDIPFILDPSDISVNDVEGILPGDTFDYLFQINVPIVGIVPSEHDVVHLSTDARVEIPVKVHYLGGDTFDFTGEMNPKNILPLDITVNTNTILLKDK